MVGAIIGSCGISHALCRYIPCGVQWAKRVEKSVVMYTNFLILKMSIGVELEVCLM